MLPGAAGLAAPSMGTIDHQAVAEAIGEASVTAVARAQRRRDISVVVTGYLGADPRQRPLVCRLGRGGRDICQPYRTWKAS